MVNCVMATDICDKQLKELRNKRWDRAFKGQVDSPTPQTADVLEEDVNRKATIVIEHLLQASDVSHTMQHFNVFRKWNEVRDYIPLHSSSLIGYVSNILLSAPPYLRNYSTKCTLPSRMVALRPTPPSFGACFAGLPPGVV